MAGENKNRHKVTFANRLHRDVFILVFFLPMVTSVVIIGILYYILITTSPDNLDLPNYLVYHTITNTRRALLGISAWVPCFVLVVFFLSFIITHRIVGPFDRIVREIDERVKGEKKGHISLRKHDKFGPLVEKINGLLDKLEQK